MDLRSALLDLVRPLAVGDELAPGVRLRGASDEVGPRIAFEVHGALLFVEVAPIEAASPCAATTRRLRFAYVSENEDATRRGLEICRAVARRAGANEDVVLESLARAAGEARTPTPRIREVRIDRLLEETQHGGRRYHTLSPYVGCLIGCRFCYAQSHVELSRRLLGRAGVPWGSYVDVRVNAAEVLARELAGSVRVVKFCPIVSDPYQAVEAQCGLTRACLEVLARAKDAVSVILLTRSKLVERDAPLLGSMGAHVGVSLPTLDDEVRAHFEPRAASVAERLAALETLRREGARPFAVVQPILPGPVDALADAIAARCDSVSLDVLRGEEGAGKDFDEPRYASARQDAWQRERAAELTQHLLRRGVPIWGELPPGVGA